MSTADRTQLTELSEMNWEAGVIGGIAGAFVMGALMIVMNEPVLGVAIPSLYTLAPPANTGVGIVVHVSHGAVLGVMFAALVSALDIQSLGTVVGGGILWGAITWVGFAGVVMPVWLSAVGSPASPPVPNLQAPSLLWHLAYGAVLGIVAPVVARRV
jgi:hypothetical protein